MKSGNIRVYRNLNQLKIPSNTTQLSVQQEQDLYNSVIPERLNAWKKRRGWQYERDESYKQLTLFMPCSELEMLTALLVKYPNERFYRSLFQWSREHSLTGPQIERIKENYNKRIKKTKTL